MWQQQGSVEKLNEAFKSFNEAGIDLHQLSGEPKITSASFDEDGAFVDLECATDGAVRVWRRLKSDRVEAIRQDDTSISGVPETLMRNRTSQGIVDDPRRRGG